MLIALKLNKFIYGESKYVSTYLDNVYQYVCEWFSGNLEILPLLLLARKLWQSIIVFSENAAVLVGNFLEWIEYSLVLDRVDQEMTFILIVDPQSKIPQKNDDTL